MHSLTLLGLFLTLTVILIGSIDGAPTVATETKIPLTTKLPKPAATAKLPKPKPVATAKPKLVGSHTPWVEKIKPKHKKIFDDYKNITSKKLQEAHKVPTTFVPTPAKFATQTVGGVNYLYLVKLPTNKYAFVSIHHQAWKKAKYGLAENVRVRPQTYELTDKAV